jgi:hypothetical protein
MARAVRILGFGRGPKGLFVNLRFLDRSVHPEQQEPITREQLIGVLRSGLAALELDEHERTSRALAKQQKAAS